MEIITNYSDNTRNMISGSSYTLPPGLNQNASYKIKLSVFSNTGIFLNDYILEANKEYYVKINEKCTNFDEINVNCLNYIKNCQMLKISFYSSKFANY